MQDGKGKDAGEHVHDVKDIRLSVGSAVKVGLRRARMEAEPTTIYTMLGDACLGACQFCTQSRLNTADKKLLSRVIWPEFPMDSVLDGVKATDGIGRICIQTLKYADLLPDLVAAAKKLAAASDAPLSICMNPVDKAWLVALKEVGVERVGIGLDCATEETFTVIKPGFSWTAYQCFIDDTINVFGRGSVHLIVGLGDSDAALVRAFQAYHDKGCSIALFAYTPVRGTALDLPQPPLERYRALQLARYLIVHDLATLDDMVFEGEKLATIGMEPAALARALDVGTAFRTSGCPSCNRPMYNERPGGVMYNHPQPLTAEEKADVREALARYLAW
jgi:biotin synthase-related radical SAM superfamily protein